VPDKNLERYYLKTLRKVVNDVPAGDPEEPEPPDFLLVADYGRVGIEMTTFHLPPPRENAHT
jgi:hypothetical protein